MSVGNTRPELPTNVSMPNSYTQARQRVRTERLQPRRDPVHDARHNELEKNLGPLGMRQVHPAALPGQARTCGQPKASRRTNRRAGRDQPALRQPSARRGRRRSRQLRGKWNPGMQDAFLKREKNPWNSRGSEPVNAESFTGLGGCARRLKTRGRALDSCIYANLPLAATIKSAFLFTFTLTRLDTTMLTRKDNAAESGLAGLAGADRADRPWELAAQPTHR